jgi:nitroimidazol reductase NimA-like FMN-containing flavoprotein (pyridoxamine 5'-phosphate oxidase superfamily)
MSAPPQVRRKDKLMSEERALAFLADGFCGRLATVGADGWPYCVPLLYVSLDCEIWVHNIAAGHLRANIEHGKRVCFEIDDPGAVFDYGRFLCDSSVAYRSAVAFGTIREIADAAGRRRFFDALMTKYGRPDSGRPKGFYPRIDEVAVYAITIERITGKETPLPEVAEQWPAKDRTKSPHAKP